MNRFFTHHVALLAAMIATVSHSGCGTSVSPEIAALREQFVVDSAPTGEKPISDVRRAMKAEELTSDRTFVVRARINAGDFPPFADGMAAFVVTDATGHDGDESHNPHECPFCKRDIKNVIARVEFKDGSGTLVKTDARELFDVKEFDLLVIEGAGRFAEDDTLIIDATKLFVRR